MSPSRFSNATNNANKSNKFKDDQKSKILKYLPIVNQWERENQFDMDHLLDSGNWIYQQLWQLGFDPLMQPPLQEEFYSNDDYHNLSEMAKKAQSQNFDESRYYSAHSRSPQHSIQQPSPQQPPKSRSPFSKNRDSTPERSKMQGSFQRVEDHSPIPTTTIRQKVKQPFLQKGLQISHNFLKAEIIVPRYRPKYVDRKSEVVKYLFIDDTLHTNSADFDYLEGVDERKSSPFKK